MSILMNEYLQVKHFPTKGRGITTKVRITEGEIVEVVPVLVFPEIEVDTIERTALGPYYYNWNDRGAVALGLASLYNHSTTPNVAFEKDYSTETITYTALRDINEDEELTINYLDPSEKHPLGFHPS